MAKFFVGQMVKVISVRHQQNQHLVGVEGRVTDLVRNFVGPILYGLDTVPIRYEERPDGTHAFGLAAWQLEPILPEGAQPLGYSFEQMMSEFGVAEAVK